MVSLRSYQRPNSFLTRTLTPIKTKRALNEDFMVKTQAGSYEYQLSNAGTQQKTNESRQNNRKASIEQLEKQIDKV